MSGGPGLDSEGNAIGINVAAYRASQLVAFLVPAETPGLVPGKPEDKMGLRASHTTTLALTDVRVAADGLLGEEGHGLSYALEGLERGRTEFRASATRSKVFEGDFGQNGAYQKQGADFDWPNVPGATGGHVDLRVYNSAPVSAGFTTHLMDPHRERAYFLAFSPASKLAFGYVWTRSDFPWLGIWEENHSRTGAPWSSRTRCSATWTA